MKPSMSVGGFYAVRTVGILDDTDETTARSGVGSGTVTSKTTAAKDDTSALDVHNDAEVHFNGRATLDNGLKIHARVELEGMTHSVNSDPIDEYFLTVSGGFGSITMGGLGGAPDKMLGGYSGTGTGVGIHPHFHNPLPNGAGGASTYINLDTGDGDKITYVSPSFGGFQVGLSYAPTMGETTGNGRVDAETGLHDGLEGAVRYSGKFGDVAFGVGAGMSAYQESNMNAAGSNKPMKQAESQWIVGSYLDFGGGFRVGAAHRKVTNDDKASRGTTTDLGVRYIQGANRFSVVGVYGEMENSDSTRATVVGGYSRTLGPGVAVGASLIWSASESATTGKGTGTESQRETDGVALVSGITVKF